MRAAWRDNSRKLILHQIDFAFNFFVPDGIKLPYLFLKSRNTSKSAFYTMLRIDLLYRTCYSLEKFSFMYMFNGNEQAPWCSPKIYFTHDNF